MAKALKRPKILKNYRDGAFSAWLIATYGNRQTPYNFCSTTSFIQLFQNICILNSMKCPRQAVYSLASREGKQEQKEQIIKNYCGQPKQELLALIRKTFPLGKEDGRAQNVTESLMKQVQRLHSHLSSASFRPTAAQRTELLQTFKELIALFEGE